MDGDPELAAFDLAFDDGREGFFRELRAAADELGPFPPVGGVVPAVIVLVAGDNEPAAGFL